MTVDEIRKRNLRLLVNDARGSSAFGRTVDRDQKYISQLISEVTEKAIGKRICRHFERALGKPEGWLDRPQWPSEASNDANSVAEERVRYELTEREGRFVDFLRTADERTKSIVDAVFAASDQPKVRKAR